ncbi:MAG TPA: adenylosuccinate lyase, partial [Clostridia bacterium]|nr:adenylosuccinate lyase [Clostridia bacterium]
AEGFLAADGLLTLYENIVSGLVVYPAMMARHLKEELPFMASENILMRAVMAGGDRQMLHERIRVHAQAAAQRVKEEGLHNDLLDRVAADPAFNLNREELEELLRPEAYTGLAARQVEDYLAGEAKEALDAHADLAGLDAQIHL